MNWFESRVHLSPGQEAVIDSATNQTWTYQQVNKRAEDLAMYFVENGIQKGDRVALLSPNHISYFDFFFAAMKIGAIFVPLNWRLTPEELKYIVDDCEPRIIGISSTLQKKWVNIGSKTKQLIIRSSNYLPQMTSESNVHDVKQIDDAPLAMIYTGGTTGRPKGVVLSYQAILWNAMNTVVSWGFSSEDTTLTTLPMFHTGGLNAFTLPILLAGGKVVVSKNFHPEKAINDLIVYRCTTALFVPTMYHLMIQTDLFQTVDFPYMKAFVSGGAPCPQRIYEAFHKKGIPFREGYGLTEAGPNNFYIDPTVVTSKRGSVGKPMLFNEIKIVSEEGQPVKTDEVGELLIRGPHSFTCYWKNTQQTEETFHNGWICTGDLAKQDQEGFVYIVGRKKDMIITGGENVYPQEIEQWLERHESVEEVAVIGLPDDKWGEVVTAFLHVNKPIDKQELITYCHRKLARYKVPKKFHLVNELPKTHVGKIDKNSLKKQAFIGKE